MNEETLSLIYTDETLIATLRGEIDHHSATPIRERIDNELYLRCPRKLIIDVGEVDFMDSSGLGLIMGRLAKASELKIALAVARPSARTARMLKMAGLDRLIEEERKESR